jgi:hypothetical protein
MSKYSDNSCVVHTKFGAIEFSVGNSIAFTKRTPTGSLGNLVIHLEDRDCAVITFDNDSSQETQTFVDLVASEELEEYFAYHKTMDIYSSIKLGDGIRAHRIILTRDEDYSLRDFLSATAALIDNLNSDFWTFIGPLDSVGINLKSEMTLKKDKIVRGENLKGQAFRVVKTFTGKKGERYVVADYGKDVNGSCLDGKLSSRSCLIFADTDIEELKPKEQVSEKPKEPTKEKAKAKAKRKRR